MSGNSVPHSPEYERACLGAILFDPDVAKISEAVSLLRPEDFFSKDNRIIFRAIVELFGRGEKIDLITVSESLKERKLLEKAGGSYYLTGLFESTPTAANGFEYAKKVKELSKQRKFRELAYRASQGDELALAELLDENATSPGASVRPLGVIPEVKEFEDYVKDEAPRPVDFVENILPSEAILLIYSSPGVGKTLFTMNLSIHLAGALPFFGSTIPNRLKVLYLLAEGGYFSVRSRIKTMAKDAFVKVPEGSLYFLPVRPFNVLDSVDFSLLENIIDDVSPHVVCIDPLLKTHIEDENDNTSMQRGTGQIQGPNHRK